MEKARISLLFVVALHICFASGSVLGDAPISHWEFDEGSGTIAYDSVGTNDGTIYGALWTSGIIDGALDFDGVDDYVDVGDPIDGSLDFGAGESFSIVAWIRSGGESGTFVFKRICTGIGGVYYEGYNVKLFEYKAYFALEDNSNNSISIHGSTVVGDEEWHQIVAVRDTGTDKLHLYVDGSADATPVTDPTISTLETDKGFDIGHSINTTIGHGYFNGKIDDVRVYGRALSSEEIWDLYLEGAGGPIAHWKLDEGEGDIAYDSADEHDGAIYGAQWTMGIIDGALDFDGVDDYVETAVFDIDKVTVSAWVNVLGETLGEEQDILNNCENAGYTLLHDRHATGKFAFYAYINGGYRTAFADAYTEQDRWYHIAGTYDGDNGYLYVDGVEQEDSFGDDGLITDSGLPLLIGANPETDGSIEYGQCFNGKIDDVRVYGRALSAEEIWDLSGGLAVGVDIKPGSCPNPLNVKSKGVLPVAILGTEEFDVYSIDAVSVRLAGVEPLRSAYEDVAAPVSDGNECECAEEEEGSDGYTDLTLKFERQKVVEALGEVEHDDVLTVLLTGVLQDGTPIEGADCIVIRGKFKPFNQGDINKDGITNIIDFAMMAGTWLESTDSD